MTSNLGRIPQALTWQTKAHVVPFGLPCAFGSCCERCERCASWCTTDPAKGAEHVARDVSGYTDSAIIYLDSCLLIVCSVTRRSLPVVTVPNARSSALATKAPSIIVIAMKPTQPSYVLSRRWTHQDGSWISPNLLFPKSHHLKRIFLRVHHRPQIWPWR